ncbi:unnamed protein product [Cuscuta campestris]|uniref:40S ribosomal protein S12 n=2 Tax=Cuscuta sect. Cleistogrammica TaxID=1824901 RepID=A0A484KYU4_9ASTE|nr:hypothetical protein DM860_007107 [Cuscuta australis]VFQ68677.1 unnamed protein product [Cuscuta campestris]
MSGEDGGPVAVQETHAAAPLGEPMDLMTAVRLVLKKSKAYGGLMCGVHQSCKAITKNKAQLCILADDCDRPDYVKLVKALCADNSVKLISVPSAKTLGEWCGLCKIDSEGTARKVVGASCVVVVDYGVEHEGLDIIKNLEKTH